MSASQAYVDAAIKSLKGELAVQLDRLESSVYLDVPNMKEELNKRMDEVTGILKEKMTEFEDKVGEIKRSNAKWDLRDPKMRGTVKFDGDRREDVRAFTKWKSPPSLISKSSCLE